MPQIAQSSGSNNQKHVFISYAREDSEASALLRLALLEQGHIVWWDVDLQAGQKWNQEIESALQRSYAVVVLWSTNSIKSDWVLYEAAIAKSKDVLYPACLDKCEPPASFLDLQTANLSAWRKDAEHSEFNLLCTALAKAKIKSDVGITRNRLPRSIIATLTLTVIALALFLSTKTPYSPTSHPSPSTGEPTKQTDSQYSDTPKSTPIQARTTSCVVDISWPRAVAQQVVVIHYRDNDFPQLDTPYTQSVRLQFSPNAINSRTSAFSDREIESFARLVADMTRATDDCRPLILLSTNSLSAVESPLQEQLLKSLPGSRVDTISNEQREKYGFFGSVPTADWSTTALVDIGSGNTIVSAMVSGELRSIQLPFGTITASRRIKDADQSSRAELVHSIKMELISSLRLAFEVEPEIRKKSNVVVVGGAAWLSATLFHPNSVRRRFTRLDERKIGEIRVGLTRENIAGLGPSEFASGVVKASYEDDIQKIMNIFSENDLTVGSALLLATVSQFDPNRRVYFSRSGQWIHGYLQYRRGVDIWGRTSLKTF